MMVYWTSQLRSSIIVLSAESGRDKDCKNSTQISLWKYKKLEIHGAVFFFYLKKNLVTNILSVNFKCEYLIIYLFSLNLAGDISSASYNGEIFFNIMY